MRIHVLSDLHLEGPRPPFQPPPVAADVVVLAGDISTGAGGVDWAKRLSPAFEERPVLYVAGNHEFYGQSFAALMGADRVALWIYGHTHQPADLEVDGTRVVSNPRGYARESIAAFDPARVYELRSR